MGQLTILAFIIIFLTNCSNETSNTISNELKQSPNKIKNEKSIVGKYLLLDNLNLQAKVEFKTDGTITGFYDFKTYHITTEINSGKSNTFNELCLNVSKYSNICFAYIIKGDTLNLFRSINYEDDVMSRPPGKAEIILVRQQKE